MPAYRVEMTSAMGAGAVLLDVVRLGALVLRNDEAPGVMLVAPNIEEGRVEP